LIRTDKVKSFWCEWPLSQLLALSEESRRLYLHANLLKVSQSKDGAAVYYECGTRYPTPGCPAVVRLFGAGQQRALL
jgi:hypothetical protein